MIAVIALIAGLVLIVAGVSAIYWPAGLIVAGALATLVAGAFVDVDRVARAGRKP